MISLALHHVFEPPAKRNLRRSMQRNLPVDIEVWDSAASIYKTLDTAGQVQLHLGQGCRSEVVSQCGRGALDWVVSANLILGANGDIDWARTTYHREPTTTTALASKSVR